MKAIETKMLLVGKRESTTGTGTVLVELTLVELDTMEQHIVWVTKSRADEMQIGSESPTDVAKCTFEVQIGDKPRLTSFVYTGETAKLVVK